ncbi:hypothetical protein [Clostridium sp. C8-1-8]|uniref:hypothetical protein n=1 Tax=Clostridium sp. C8-1-8 TaxID=2698831 RepID=UPI0013697941|nr:hypothetical protein [Clostridium sp. C8-1-8]
MEFYIMTELFSNYATAIVQESPKKVVECEKCKSIDVILLDKLRVCMKGKKVADYYWVPSTNIISGRLQELLKYENVKGYELKELIVEDWVDSNYRSIEIDYSDLREIVITSKCGYLRQIDGRIVDKCEKCGNKIYEKRKEVEGLSVDLEKWDGSDMFCYDNWKGVIIVTERLKKLIEKGKYKNIQFINIKDFRFS